MACSLALLLTSPAAWSAGPSRTLVLAPNQVFQVTLAANPSAGYKWVLTKLPDEKVVKLVSSEYVAAKPEAAQGQAPVGAGGHEIWTFQAMGPGRVCIVLNYMRPWEKEKPAAKSRSLEVEVR
jgi:inhibitor of cysteine peptidase